MSKPGRKKLAENECGWHTGVTRFSMVNFMCDEPLPQILVSPVQFKRYAPCSSNVLIYQTSSTIRKGQAIAVYEEDLGSGEKTGRSVVVEITHVSRQRDYDTGQELKRRYVLTVERIH